MDILLEALKAAMSDDLKGFKTRAEAEKALTDYLNCEPSDIAVGDRVERNELGRNRYKFPNEKQAAVCVEVFENPVKDSQGEMNDMRICVALDPDNILHYDVNSRYYRKVGANTTNIFSFRKK